MNDSKIDALAVSVDIQEAASALGFDWPDAFGVLGKIEEEAGEIRMALEEGDGEQARRELGDLLLAAVNLSRFLKTDPDDELARATERFSKRFDALQTELKRQGREIKECTLEELDAVWNTVKRGMECAGENGS